MHADVPLIRSERKLDGLHGLRAVAALSVVLFHMQAKPALPQPDWLAAVTVHFYLAVQLFFAISAFSLYHSSRYAPAGYGGYLVKRYFRIAPLFYLMLAYVLWRVRFPGWPAVLANLTFTFNLFPGLEQSIVFAGWSVGVEMLFYLLLPALLLLGRPGAYALLYAVTAAASAAFWRLAPAVLGVGDDFAYYSIVNAMPAFAAGLFAYSAFMRLDGRPRRRGWNVALGAAAAALLALAFLDPLGLHWRLPGLYFAAWGLPFGALCLWQALYPSRAMGSRITHWFADRSFSIYLLHPVVLELVRRAYDLRGKLGLPDGEGVRAGMLVAGLAFLFAAASFTYRRVELPGIALGRRIAGRLDAGAPNPAAAERSLEPDRRKAG